MDLQTPALYLLLGSQGKGKTYLLKYLMYQLRKKLKYGIVFTNTFFDNNPFPFIPAKYIHPEYSEEALEELMNIQANSVAKGKVKEAFVIFDDCLDSNDQFKSNALKRLSTQLRHYHITLFMSTQYCNLLPPRIRTNAMGVFIFENDTKINLMSVYESFGQRFDSYGDFKDYVLKNLAQKYSFIYYNKSTTATKLEDVYEVMICPPKIPKFHIKF